MTTPQTTPEQMARALAIVLRDKYVADARQNLKAARELEKQYQLTPAQINKRG